MNQMNQLEQMKKITQNLADTIGLNLLETKIEKGKQLSVYIGFAPTGKIHLGYLVPCTKIKDLVDCGIKVVILLADVHAMIDDRKTPKELVNYRSLYYEKVITQILIVLRVHMSFVSFIKGSDFQLSGDYMMDVLELSNRVTISAAKKAGTEVVKQNKDPKLGSAIYPVMQAVDENYVGQFAIGQQIDIELGGIDQRKIFCFSKDHDIKSEPLTYLMNPIVSLTKTGKMSASVANSKISFDDDDEIVSEKISKAFCADGDINCFECGVIKLYQCVIFPHFGKVRIGEKSFDSFDQFIKSFQWNEIDSKQIKLALSDYLIELISPIRNFLMTDELLQLSSVAYP